MYLNDEYTKVDENTYTFYDKETKMNVKLFFRPKETAVDIDKKVTNILGKLYVQKQVNMLTDNYNSNP